ncbi:hypothetical protein IT570_10870 [Candidatus Sumerlaeota bacterium]|nr:hypothetical protein [Candidatus Sumerlaeota bacterium]
MTLILFAFLVCAAIGMGRFSLVMLRSLATGTRDRAAREPVSVAFAIGMGVQGSLALVLLAMGALHWLWLVVGVLLFAHTISRGGSPSVPDEWRNLPACLKFGGVIFIAGVCAIFWLCLTPAQLVDSYMYHLLVPKQWVIHGRAVAFPYDLCSNYFLLTQAWTAWGFAIAPDDLLLPKLTEWLSATLTSALIFRMAAREGSRGAGLLAACAWIWSSHLWEYAASAHIDASEALFVVAGASVFLREITDHNQRDALALAGLLFGFAIAAKISGGVFFLMALVAIACNATATGGLRVAAARCAIFSVAAGIPVLPWLIRNWEITGAPLYPYFVDVFPTHREYLQAARDFHADFNGYGFGGSFLQSVPAYLSLFFANVLRLDHNIYISSGLIGLLLQLRRERVKALRDFFFVFGVLCAIPGVFSPFPRFMFAAEAILVALGAKEIRFLFNEVAPRFQKPCRVAICVLAFVLLAHRGKRLAEYDSPAVWDGPRSRPSLSMLFPGHGAQATIPEMPLVKYLNENHGASGRILLTENRYFSILLNIPVLINPHMHSPNLLRMMAHEGATADDIAARLRGYGVTKILTSDALADGELERFRKKHLVTEKIEGDLTLYQLD